MKKPQLFMMNMDQKRHSHMTILFGPLTDLIKQEMDTLNLWIKNMQIKNLFTRN